MANANGDIVLVNWGTEYLSWLLKGATISFLHLVKNQTYSLLE